MAKPHAFSNETINNLAQCKVLIYPWSTTYNIDSLSDDQLSAATALDISSQITSFQYSKNMGSASGSFSFSLTNSPNYGTNDWKDIIKRGFWCVIYCSNDGDLTLNPNVGKNLTKSPKSEAKKIRCIGYIERVGVVGSTGDNREIDINYTVTGRDFGIIYDATDIWHNMFAFDQIILDSLKTSKMNVTGNIRVHEAIRLIHDLFFFPKNLDGAKTNDNKSLLSIGLQWLMPRRLLNDIGMDLTSVNQGTYWGALPNIMKLSETSAGLAVDNPADFLTGNAWEQLRRISVPQFHELFCELNDNGLPRLVFRPIPWGIDKSKYPKMAKFIKLYKDIKEIVLIPAVKLIDFDLGEDDHNRYNSFLTTVSTGLIGVEDNISLLLGSGYPKNNHASIRRHGFRPMHVQVDSIVKNAELANGSSDQQALIEFNELLFDYWNNSIFAETGSVQIVGSNDVRIGKCMKFGSDVPYMNSKRYYIEGYADSYEVGEKGEMEWTQTVNLTRGFEEADLKSNSGFLDRNAEFTASGEYTPRGSSGDKS